MTDGGGGDIEGGNMYEECSWRAEESGSEREKKRRSGGAEERRKEGPVEDSGKASAIMLRFSVTSDEQGT